MSDIHNKPKPLILDFENIRNSRQHNNNKIVYQSIKTNNIILFNENINYKEFIRTLKDLKISKEECLKKCINDDMFCIVISRLISKNATRQSTKDEFEQLRICSIIPLRYNITIKKLTTSELRPTKDGKIITRKEMDNLKIPKDCCLKSFDGKIIGTMNGFISSKISYGTGGHQDNVLEEMDILANWWKTYKYNTNDVLVLLIDTNFIIKFKRLQEKYHTICNIIILNHIEFQEYIINTYHRVSSI